MIAALVAALILASVFIEPGSDPYTRALDATVRIERTDQIGSGTLLTNDGLILTNAHVVEGVDSVEVTFHDGTKATGRVLWRGDKRNDLALVEAGGDGRPVGVRTSPLGVGERVFSVGHSTRHFPWSVAIGHVAFTDRNHGEDSTPRMVQIDMSIHGGNSGGGLYDMDGRLVGLMTAAYAINVAAGPMRVQQVPTNISFAIPISTVCRSAPCRQ